MISNASDALEKFRYSIHTAGENEKDFEDPGRALEIQIATDKTAQILTVQVIIDTLLIMQRIKLQSLPTG